MKGTNEYKEMLLATMEGLKKEAKKLNMDRMEIRGVLLGLEMAKKAVEESDPE